MNIVLFLETIEVLYKTIEVLYIAKEIELKKMIKNGIVMN